jgi:hypothetical protein
VDKESKKIVWEFNHDYKGGFANGHEPEMIEKGLPGEGNILVYDNALFPKDRTRAGQSFILEVNPVSKQIVWKYKETNQRFFSRTRSTQKRLPNGNTFIDEDDTGRLFQVTPKVEIVWEYVHSTITYRPAPYAYDYCPQLKAMPKPPENGVTPPNNLEWKLLPDKFRK